MDKVYGVSRFVMESGERSCLVVDRSSGLPSYYPNLYLTTQLRNRGVAFATLEAEAGHLIVLLRFLDKRKIDLDDRIRSGKLLEGHEIDSLRDYIQRKPNRISRKLQVNSAFTLDELGESFETVSKGTQHARLTAVARYLNWYGGNICSLSTDAIRRLINLCDQINSRRPSNKHRVGNRRDKSISDDQLDVLFEVIRPGSELNPFAKLVQRRNRLVVLMLFHLGLRGSELLNIRIQDIDFSKNQISIIRRPDEKSDPRVNEPNVKTRSRILPIGDVLIKEIHDYITQERRKNQTKPDSKNEYLFLTHKHGPTKGQPISKPGYFKIISVIRAVSPELYALSGHMLRHTWNRKFSERMDSMDQPPGEARQEQMRSYLMGWKEGSGTAAIYNQRFIEEKGMEAALKLQNASKVRLPKGLKGEG